MEGEERGTTLFCRLRILICCCCLQLLLLWCYQWGNKKTRGFLNKSINLSNLLHFMFVRHTFFMAKCLVVACQRKKPPLFKKKLKKWVSLNNDVDNGSSFTDHTSRVLSFSGILDLQGQSWYSWLSREKKPSESSPFWKWTKKGHCFIVLPRLQ